jgi:predicted dehydrogenase
MITIAVIGYGFWGANIVRNFQCLHDVRLKGVCDLDPAALTRVKSAWPSLEVTSDYMQFLHAPDIDAIAVVTPVSAHYPLVKRALENGKHVFVEKPFTNSVDHAEELVELAEKKNRIIMVDHTFLFTGAVKRIKELIDSDVLGEIYYYDSVRINLGLFQSDVNVLWDLAPHDFSIMEHLIKKKPLAIVATGQRHVNHHEDVSYVTVYFTENIIAHFNVNWLSPVKVRTTLIGGEKKMLVWNDLEADEKIKVYDKGVRKNGNGRYDLLVSYRMGDIWAPRVEHMEALKVEAQYFVDCIKGGTPPINDGRAGLRIVQMLAAADASMSKKGQMVYL